ncbi:MAG: CHASE2 domain-containing protein [Burkholderiales bacterium]|nr:CHASE2 domain-containing protein [Burkholderiales bacterium]
MIARLAARARRAIRAGRGRWVTLLVLAVLSLPIAFPDYSPFTRLRLAWLDFYQIVLPRARRSDNVVIVAIDEASLRKLGQWPWPRTRLAELIDRIGAAGASAIGLDIVMPEPDQTSPEALIPRLDPSHASVIAELAALPPNDARLAAAIARYPVVLGVAGADNAAALTNTTLLTKTPIVLEGGPIDTPLRQYRATLASLLRFQRAARGQGIMNADLERGVVRRAPLVSTNGVALLPAFALELVRVANHAPALTVDVHDGAIASVNAGDLRIPTQPDGALWLHFSRPVRARYVSALDVFDADPNTALARLRGKIVIVGITGLALVDSRVTARAETVPGTEVHAQIVESLYDRRFLRRPHWLSSVEAISLLVLGGLLVWAVPTMRRQGALLLLGASLLFLGTLGFALFAWTGLLFDAASVTVALFAVFGTLITAALAQADHDRRMSQRSLRTAREAAARVAGELEAARRIQLGSLPRSDTSFPHERRFELAAAVEPALIVGGDLYDFFMLDPDRLFFHIADVSGKGIPASMFMSITKALTKSVALRAGEDAASLLTQTNIELARDNPESMFVTAFAAILAVESGELTYWTAGHETPFVCNGNEVYQLDRSASGPPLCTLETFEYREQYWRLRPGDSLVLFTDGIAEAENAAGALYGKERLAQCLRRLPAGTSAAAVVQAVRADVGAFVAGAPASDDLTLLVLRWLGPDATPSAR